MAKNHEGNEMRKAIILFPILFSSFLVGVSPVSAAYGYEYVVVAWDEEFQAHGDALDFYKYTWVGSIVPLDAKQYSDWQWSRALYWFHKNFGKYKHIKIIGYLTFDSYDYGDLPYTLLEAIEETGFRDGIYFDGIRATMLMVWTLQDNCPLAGGAFPDERAFIVQYQEPWADDNVLMHELSHMWIATAPSDTAHGECLMSTTRVFMGFYDEPLQPDWGHITLMLFQEAEWVYFAYQWCSKCKEIIIKNMLAEDPPPDPWIGDLGEPSLIYPILIIVGIAIGAVFFLYIVEKKQIFRKFMKSKNSKTMNITSYYYLILKLISNFSQGDLDYGKKAYIPRNILTFERSLRVL